MQNEDQQRVGEQKEPPGKVMMVQKKKKLWRCKKKKKGKSTVLTLTKKCGPFENRNMYMSCSQIVKILQGQGQLECKKMNSQTLKKPLKQECSVGRFKIKESGGGKKTDLSTTLLYFIYRINSFFFKNNLL